QALRPAPRRRFPRHEREGAGSAARSAGPVGRAELAAMKLLRDLLAKARARLALRPDTEHEQAIVRVLVALALGAYLLDFQDLTQFGMEDVVWYAYLGVSLVILAWVLASVRVSHVRRCLGLVADMSTVAFSMWYFGERALPLLLVYAWVTFANGFRFG